MISLTPRQVGQLIKVLLGLVVVAVGIGIFIEYFEHRELYPSRKRAIGSSRLHWMFWLAFFTVLIGGGFIYRNVRDRCGRV